MRLSLCPFRQITSVIIRPYTSNTKRHNHISSKRNYAKRKLHFTSVYCQNHSQAIQEYLNSKDCLRIIKNKIPEKLLSKRFSQPKYLYLIDSDIASEVFEVLRPYLEQHKGPFMEVNAGIGVLTKELLKAKLPRLLIYENYKAQIDNLLVLVRENLSDAAVYQADFKDICYKQRQFETGSEINIFENVPVISWEDDPVVMMIATTGSESSVKSFMYSIIFHTGICRYGRPQIFFILPSTVMNKMTFPRKRRNWKHVLYQALFDFTILKKLPSKAFIPWLVKGKTKNITSMDDSDMMCLMKLTPRKDIFKRLPQDQLKLFWFFVLQLTIPKQSIPLVAQLERWVPGFGVKLIAMGYTIFTSASSLSYDDLEKIFMEFTSWPTFKSSSFIPAMENALMNLNTGEITEKSLTESIDESVVDSDISSEEDSLDEDDVLDDIDSLDEADGLHDIPFNKKKSS